PGSGGYRRTGRPRHASYRVRCLHGRSPSVSRRKPTHGGRQRAGARNSVGSMRVRGNSGREPQATTSIRVLLGPPGGPLLGRRRPVCCVYGGRAGRAMAPRTLGALLTLLVLAVGCAPATTGPAGGSPAPGSVPAPPAAPAASAPVAQAP